MQTACPSRARTPSAPSTASGRSVRRLSALSRSPPARVEAPPRPRCLARRTSTRRHSWIDLLQKGSEVGELLAPEGAVVAHPIDKWGETLRLGAVVDLAALGAFGDQAGQLQRLEVLGDGALRH